MSRPSERRPRESGPASPRRSAVAWFAAAGLAALFLAFGSFQIYGYDVPLHLITGEYLIRDPGSAGVELFSFIFPGYAWLNDKWLENVLVHLVDRLAGGPGLVTLRVLLALGLAALTGIAMRSGAETGHGASGRVVGVLALSFLPFVAYERFLLRPELFSLLLISTVLWLTARDQRSRAEWIGIAALHALWVNLHGYWIVGPLIVGAFLAGDLIEAGAGRWGWPAKADPAPTLARAAHRSRLLLASFGGALVSPHPWELFFNPFRVLLFVGEEQGAMWTISELRSPFNPRAVFNLAIGCFVAAAVATLVVLIISLFLRRLRVFHLLLAGGFFVMAASARRNIGMFAIVAAVVSVWSLRGTARRPASRWPRAAPLALALLGVADLLGAAYVATDRLYVADGTSRKTGFSMSTLTYGRGLADFFREVRPRGRFFNGFASGSYLVYRLYPEYRAYITGNTFKYPREFFEEYSLVSFGGEEYKRVAEKYGLAGFSMLYNSADMMPLAKRLFNDPDYVAVYFDDNSLLFVRRAPELAPIIEAHRVDFPALARRRDAEAPPEVDRSHGWLPIGRKIRPRGELNRATFLHQVAMFPEAEVEYRRALKVDPRLVDARHGLGDVILAQSRVEEALEIFEPLLSRDPFNAHLHRDLAEAYSTSGARAASRGDWVEARWNLEAAIDLIQRAKRLDPEGDPLPRLEANNCFNLGYVLLQQSKDAGATETDLASQADKQFATALTLQPSDRALRYRVARLMARRGRYDKALALLEEALRTRDPRLVDETQRDPAWNPLRSDPRLRALIGPG